MAVNKFKFVSETGQTIEKDAVSESDFGVDWASWLKPGEVISTSLWEVPAAITKMTTPADGINGGITFLWLKGGGSVGDKHLIRNTITTDQQRKEIRSFTIIIAKR